MIRLRNCCITNLYMRLFFLKPSLIGSINDRIFILTNRQVVLMRLTNQEFWQKTNGVLGLSQVTFLICRNPIHRLPNAESLSSSSRNLINSCNYFPINKHAISSAISITHSLQLWKYFQPKFIFSHTSLLMDVKLNSTKNIIFVCKTYLFVDLNTKCSNCKINFASCE